MVALLPSRAQVSEIIIKPTVQQFWIWLWFSFLIGCSCIPNPDFLWLFTTSVLWHTQYLALTERISEGNK
jgi:hypothetical protein